VRTVVCTCARTPCEQKECTQQRSDISTGDGGVSSDDELTAKRPPKKRKITIEPDSAPRLYCTSRLTRVVLT
jgi:hypothetical protein